MKFLTRLPYSASVNANVNTAQIFPDPNNLTAPAALLLPGTSRMEQRRFVVRASGYAKPGAGVTSNVTVTLYGYKGGIPATPLTAGSWTVIKASSARSYADVASPWMLQAALICDSVSGLLHGSVEFCVINTLDAAAAVTNVLTTLNTATEPWLALAVGITFATADAGNKGVMAEFGAGF